MRLVIGSGVDADDFMRVLLHMVVELLSVGFCR